MVRRAALMATVPLVVCLAACGASHPIRCTTNADCLQGRISGTCLDSPSSSERWCAFSDPGCPDSSLRWGVKSGDDLAGECVAGAASAALSVTLTGAGGGTVISDPAGIDCPGTCSADFAAGSAVTLRATAESGSFFEGWSMPCAGAECALTIAAPTSVAATFLVSGSTRSADAFDHFLPQLIASDGSLLGYQPRTNTVIEIRKLERGESQPTWSTSVTSDGDSDDMNGMALLPGGDLVVAAGGVSGIGGQSITFPDQALVSRLDAATGVPRWVVGFPMEDPYVGQRLAVDTSGNSFYAGTYRGATTIGGFPLPASGAGDKNVFVAKISSAGQLLWVVGLGGSTADVAHSLAVGADGLPVLLVQASGSTNLGTQTIGGFGGEDCAVAKLATTDGHTLFSQAIGSTMSDECLVAGASANSSEFAVVLTAAGPFKAGTESFAGPGTAILGYSAAGTRNRLFSTTSTSLVSARMAFAADDSYWLSGAYTGTPTFGGGTLPGPTSGTLGYAAHISADDEHLFSTPIGLTASARGEGVVTGERSVTVLGYFFGLAAFGERTLSATAAGSGFMWTLVP